MQRQMMPFLCTTSTALLPKESCWLMTTILPEKEHAVPSPTPTTDGATMTTYTVGNYLATRFEQIGLKHYFMVPGDYNLVLLDQLLWNKNVEQVGCCMNSMRHMLLKGMHGPMELGRSLLPS